MDSNKTWDVFLRIFSTIISLLVIVHIFTKVSWLPALIGVLFVVGGILDMIRRYQEGARKVYQYLLDVVIMAGGVYYAIVG